MISINESGMLFGPYEEGTCFYIEESPIYRRIQQGVKVAEFLLIKKKQGKKSTVWVVEAKSSSPKPGSHVNFDVFIQEIKTKMINAFSLALASCLKRHDSAKEHLPQKFQQLKLSTVGFRFVLVINGHEESWLPPIQDALHNELHGTRKTWALAPDCVAVLNKDMATEKGLVMKDSNRGKERA